MIFKPFFTTAQNDPIDKGVDSAIDTHEGMSEQDKICLRMAYRFLFQYRGSKDTFLTYRKELEKLFQWAGHFRKNIPINRLRAEDLEHFFEFATKPAKEWVALKVVRRMIKGEPNPHWKPFAVSSAGVKTARSSQKSLKSLFAITSSFYDFLTTEGVSEHNPVRNIRQKSKFFTQFTKDPVRRLSNEQVDYLFKAAHKAIEADENTGERNLWVLSLLLHCYMRISELVVTEYHAPLMSDFHKDEHGVWWLSVIGKGRKERLIPLSSDVEKALCRYRQHLGLSPYPSRSDGHPLVHDARYSSQVLSLGSTRQVRKIIDNLYQQAKLLMRDDGYTHESDSFDDATVHWLRHTGISEDVKKRPREHVKEDAGHASLSTTEKYIDIELRERALSRIAAQDS